MVCLLNNRKKGVSRNWIRGINFSLIESEQPNFYAENIPFSCNSLLAVLRPSFVPRRASLRLFPNASLSLSRAFRHGLNHHTKTPHPGQSYNVTPNTIHDQEDVSSIFPIARFSIPDLILYARHIRARFERPRAWFLSPQQGIQLADSKSLWQGAYTCEKCAKKCCFFIIIIRNPCIV